MYTTHSEKYFRQKGYIFLNEKNIVDRMLATQAHPNPVYPSQSAFVTLNDLLICNATMYISSACQSIKDTSFQS